MVELTTGHYVYTEELGGEHLIGFFNNQVTFKRKLKLVQRKEMDGFDSDRKNYCKQGQYMKGRNSISQYEYNSLFSLKYNLKGFMGK